MLDWEYFEIFQIEFDKIHKSGTQLKTSKIGLGVDWGFPSYYF